MGNNFIYPKKEVAKAHKQLEARLEKVLFERREAELLNVTIEYREKFYDAVRSGDQVALEGMFETEFDWVPGTLASEDMRNLKNLSIGAVSIMCDRLITDRVLDSEVACSISDAGIQMLEEAQSYEVISTVMIVCFIEFTMQVARKKGSEQRYHHLAKEAKDYVMKNLHGKIKISEIADSLGTNASYLSRVFKQYEGITLQSYIRAERLLRAQNLLKVSELSLEDISEYLGFSSQSYLGKLLKAKTGMTPKEYRMRFNDSYRDHF